MKWYNKYLSLYGKPFNNIPINIIKEIRANIKAKQSDHPLVSIAIIAHNEEYHLAANIWSLSETISKYPIVLQTELLKFLKHWEFPFFRKRDRVMVMRVTVVSIMLKEIITFASILTLYTLHIMWNIL